MKRVYQILSYILVAILAATVTFCACDYSRQTAEMSKLDQLSNLINERFIGEADRTAYEDAAAEAMVAALGDEWSYYLPAADYQAHMETMNNAYVGIGVTIVVREEGDGFEVTTSRPARPPQSSHQRTMTSRYSAPFSCYQLYP